MRSDSRDGESSRDDADDSMNILRNRAAGPKQVLIEEEDVPEVIIDNQIDSGRGLGELSKQYLQKARLRQEQDMQAHFTNIDDLQQSQLESDARRAVRVSGVQNMLQNFGQPADDLAEEDDPSWQNISTIQAFKDQLSVKMVNNYSVKIDGRRQSARSTRRPVKDYLLFGGDQRSRVGCTRAIQESK